MSHDHTHMLGLTATIIPSYEAMCPPSPPLSSQHVLGVNGVHDEKRPPGAPTRSLLHELDRNLNLLEVDHEQTTAHVHGINDAEFGARKDEYLRLRRFVLKDRVPHNVDTPLHLNVQRLCVRPTIESKETYFIRFT